MRESGFYPPGAEFDPSAPYNQHDPELVVSVGSIEYNYEDDEVVVAVDWYADGKFCGCDSPIYAENCLSTIYYFTISEHGQKTAAEWEDIITNQL